MKEVRFNDRLWFGKHSGVRISELIKADPNYIQKLIKEGKIKLDEKSNKAFEDRMGISEAKKNSFRYTQPPVMGFDPAFGAPVQRAERFGNLGDIMEASVVVIYNHLSFQNVIHAITSDLLRGEFNNDIVTLLSNDLWQKVIRGVQPLIREGRHIRLTMNRYSNDRDLQHVRLKIFDRLTDDEIIQVQFRH